MYLPAHTIYGALAAVVYSLQPLGCEVLTSYHLGSHHVVVGLASALHLPGALPSTLANHPDTKLGDERLSLLFSVTCFFGLH